MRKFAVEFMFRSTLRLEQGKQNLEHIDVHDLVISYNDQRHTTPSSELISVVDLASLVPKKVGIEEKSVRLVAMVEGLKFLGY